MAKSDELTHATDPSKSVSLNDPMPPTEPGHKGESINGGAEIFDPNAALRYKEGRGPGLQDSERLQPAHWPQSASADSAAGKALIEREAKRLEKQAKDLRDTFKDNDDSGAVIVPVGEGDLRGETKSAK
jgi:hypothetical protein